MWMFLCPGSEFHRVSSVGRMRQMTQFIGNAVRQRTKVAVD